MGPKSNAPNSAKLVFMPEAKEHTHVQRWVSDEDSLYFKLAGLGYPGFAYLGEMSGLDPTEVVCQILLRPNVNPRLMMGVPWVLSHHDLNWLSLIAEVKAHEAQNRLGYLVHLARKAAQSQERSAVVDLLSQWEDTLAACRLDKEDMMGKTSMSDLEKEWLERYRPEEATYWHVLTNDGLDSLQHYV